jgi:hypothetical protein
LAIFIFLFGELSFSLLRLPFSVGIQDIQRMQVPRDVKEGYRHCHKGAEQMLTEEQIIAIKKEAIADDPGKPWGDSMRTFDFALDWIADDPGKPWGDSIAFARLIESVIRAEYEYIPNKTIVK